MNVNEFEIPLPLYIVVAGVYAREAIVPRYANFKFNSAADLTRNGVASILLRGRESNDDVRGRSVAQRTK